MLLCKKDGLWYLAVRARAENRGCALRVGPKMPNEGGFEPVPPIGALLAKQVDAVSGITFYPDIRVHGLRVFPQAWHRDSSEPQLRCALYTNEISSRITEFKDLAKRQRIYDAHVQALQRDGWSWDAREGGEKYVHVDELEKLEGPPPEGVF
jgi:hypothetical protein